MTVSGADAGLCDGSTYTWSLIVPATSMMTPGPDDAAALETVAQRAAGFSQELFTSFPDADTYLITARDGQREAPRRVGKCPVGRGDHERVRPCAAEHGHTGDRRCAVSVADEGRPPAERRVSVRAMAGSRWS